MSAIRNKDIQFISYLDDNDQKIEGYFEVINSDHVAYIEFKSKDNIVKIPWHRVLKHKKKEGDKNDF